MATDKLTMSVTLNCDDEGKEGTPLDLAFSSVLLPAAAVDGFKALTTLAAGAKRQLGGGTITTANPNYKPNALTAEERGEPTATKTYSDMECLTIYLKNYLIATLTNEIAIQKQEAASAAASQAGATIGNGVQIV